MREQTPHAVAAEIQDGATLLLSGNGEMLTADELIEAVARRFVATGHPRDLTLLYNVFPGGKRPGTGIERLAHRGLLKRVYAGSYYSLQAMGLSTLTVNNDVEAYLLPYGYLYGMMRAAASNQPGFLTRVGLGTFLDPRNGGGKITERTAEDVVSLIEVGGEEFLYLPAISFDVALLRGTTADEDGNISLEQEPNSMGVLLQAMATNATGGKVVVQVAQLAAQRSIPPRDVVIPGVFVDEVVVVPDQMAGLPYDPAWTGKVRVPTPSPGNGPIDHQKLVARRAACELRPRQLVNVGMGLSAGVPAVAFEEGIAHQLTFNVEHGPLGGVPNDRTNFGPSINMTSFLDSPYIFDMYASGRLDMAYLGLGEIDPQGSVNVSLINGRYNLGGFLDIVHAAKSIVFCGTFTAGGLETHIEDGRLTILKEGKHRKFVSSIKQTSFNGQMSLKKGQKVIYVTERAVFRLAPEGLLLTEIAPGIDLQTQVLDLMDFRPIVSDELKTTDSSVLTPGAIGLAGSRGFSERNLA